MAWATRRDMNILVRELLGGAVESGKRWHPSQSLLCPLRCANSHDIAVFDELEFEA